MSMWEIISDDILQESNYVPAGIYGSDSSKLSSVKTDAPRATTKTQKGEPATTKPDTSSLKAESSVTLIKTEAGGEKRKLYIWSGQLKWSEKKLTLTEDRVMTRSVRSHIISYTRDNGKPEVSNENWPKDLRMEIVPMQKLEQLGTAWILKSKAVSLIPEKSFSFFPILEVLRKGNIFTLYIAGTKTLFIIREEDGEVLGFCPENGENFMKRLKGIELEKSEESRPLTGQNIQTLVGHPQSFASMNLAGFAQNKLTPMDTSMKTVSGASRGNPESQMKMPQYVAPKTPSPYARPSFASGSAPGFRASASSPLRPPGYPMSSSYITSSFTSTVTRYPQGPFVPTSVFRNPSGQNLPYNRSPQGTPQIKIRPSAGMSYQPTRSPTMGNMRAGSPRDGSPPFRFPLQRK